MLEQLSSSDKMYGGIKIMVVKCVKVRRSKASIVDILDGVNDVRSRLLFVGRLIDERERITKGNEDLMQELFNYVSEQLKSDTTLLKNFK